MNLNHHLIHKLHNFFIDLQKCYQVTVFVYRLHCLCVNYISQCIAGMNQVDVKQEVVEGTVLLPLPRIDAGVELDVDIKQEELERTELLPLQRIVLIPLPRTEAEVEQDVDVMREVERTVLLPLPRVVLKPLPSTVLIPERLPRIDSKVEQDEQSTTEGTMLMIIIIVCLIKILNLATPRLYLHSVYRIKKQLHLHINVV